jgi:beta-glucosidase
VKELKAFRKVRLQAGEEQTVQFELTDDMFRYFDAGKHEWLTDRGTYDIYIGTASDNTPLKITYTVQ